MMNLISYSYNKSFLSHIKTIKNVENLEKVIEHIKDFEKISCIIIVNNHDVNKVKLACSQNNIPYIFDG